MIGACAAPPDREIVACCCGPYCVLSYEAVAMLRARGFKVRRLEDGLPEWRAAGLPVETGLQGSKIGDVGNERFIGR